MSNPIDVHLAYLRAAGSSPNTVQDRRELLARLDRDIPGGVAAATDDDLAMWLGRPGWKPKTRETYWVHMVGFFRWRSIRNGVPDPSADLPRPKTQRGLPRPVTDEQLRYAVARAERPWLTAIVLAAWAGMRAGEVAATARSDITQDRITIVGKGGKVRAVPTHPDVWAEVVDLPPGPLVRVLGHPLDGDGMSSRCSRYLTAIGLPDVTLHRFRHWFGTTVQREYRDLRITQELMGHTSPSTTAGYAAITDGQRRLAISTLPTLRSHQVIAA